MSLVEHVVVPLARAFEPQLVLVSAGYDAHRDDLLADCTVTEEGFAAMARAVSRTCESLAAPIGGVLEGGYALGVLGRLVAATLQAFAAPARVADSARAPETERDPDRARGARSARRVVAAARATKRSQRLGARCSTIRRARREVATAPS